MRVKFTKELYPKQAILKAAQFFTDKYYMSLDNDEQYYYINIEPIDGEFEKDIEKKPRSPYSNIMGLTLTNQYHNYAVTDSGPIEMGDGYYCTIPLEVKIMTGYLDPTIYLANSMEKGTCVFRKTVRHEQQHLDLANIYLRRYVKELAKRVPLMIKETGPLLSLSPNPEKGLLQIYQEKLEVIFNFYFNEWRENTRKMDTDENYERESRLCR